MYNKIICIKKNEETLMQSDIKNLQDEFSEKKKKIAHECVQHDTIWLK